jgi:hypothetical protein
MLRGAQDVAAAALASTPRARQSVVALINGSPGILMALNGQLHVALTFEVVDGLVTTVDVLAAPRRLAALEVALP